MADETTLEDRIKEVLRERGQMGLGELAEALSDVATYEVVKQTAHNLKKQKVISSPHRGVYALPGYVNDNSKSNPGYLKKLQPNTRGNIGIIFVDVETGADFFGVEFPDYLPVFNPLEVRIRTKSKPDADNLNLDRG